MSHELLGMDDDDKTAAAAAKRLLNCVECLVSMFLGASAFR